MIGCISFGGTDDFVRLPEAATSRGTITNAKLWPRALSAQEIKANYERAKMEQK